jgi:hypothetical protein
MNYAKLRLENSLNRNQILLLSTYIKILNSSTEMQLKPVFCLKTASLIAFQEQIAVIIV